MSTIQELLDEEAKLSNNGLGDSKERQEILKVIRVMRKRLHQPLCFGQDDCSTNMLSKCPWRMDCGSVY
jgi:hypothetical protein